MLHLFRYAILFVALFGALALPVAPEPLFDELEAREIKLQISLRESKPRTENWHFALVMHSSDPDGGKLAAHEFVIFDKCMVYDNTRKAKTSADQIKATAKLLPGRARSDSQLETQITNLLRSKFKDAGARPSSPGGFVNCFDFTMQAMEALQTAGYVDATGIAPFTQYYNANKEEVRQYTDAGTVAACSLSTRALGGKPNPACRGKATKGKKRASPKGKAAPRPAQGKRAPPKGRK